VPVEEAPCEAFVLLPPVVPEAEVDPEPRENSSNSSTGGSSTIETVAIWAGLDGEGSGLANCAGTVTELKECRGSYTSLDW